MSPRKGILVGGGAVAGGIQLILDLEDDCRLLIRDPCHFFPVLVVRGSGPPAFDDFLSAQSLLITSIAL